MNKFNLNTNRNFNILLTLAFVIGALLRIYLSLNLDISHQHGDSTARANIVLDPNLYGFKLIYSPIWPSFYFYLFSIPAKISRSIESIKLLQLFFSICNLYLFSLLIKKYFSSQKVFVLTSLFIFALLPISLRLAPTVLAEVSLLFFILTTLYFYDDNKVNFKRFLISAISISIACQIKYEAWILFGVMFIYEFFLYKSLRRLSILAFCFLLPLFLFEYANYLNGKPLFFALLSNAGESAKVNIQMGLEHWRLRLAVILNYFYINFYVLSIFIPIGVIFAYLKKPFNLYKSYHFLCLFILAYQILKNDVACFQRYWLVGFVLSIPYLTYVIILIQKSIIKIIASILIISIHSYSSYLDFNRLNFGKDKSYYVVSFLSSFDNVKSIYFDDKDAQYFHAKAILYGNILLDKSTKYHHKEYNVYRDNLAQFTKNDLAEFNSYIKNNLDVVTLIKDSKLYNFLNKKNFIVSDDKLVKFGRIDDVFLYCLEKSSCSKFSDVF